MIDLERVQDAVVAAANEVTGSMASRAEMSGIEADGLAAVSRAAALDVIEQALELAEGDLLDKSDFLAVNGFLRTIKLELEQP